MIKFVQLDPRNTDEARAHNDQIFASGPVLGIEITIPKLAAKCGIGNINHYIDVMKEKQSAIVTAYYFSRKLPTHSDYLGGFDSPNNSICIVTSAHRAASMIGYCMAPVVIAINPDFKFRDLPSVRKITICSWSDRYADISAIAKDLNKLESGWGGHGNICGSPQGISTKLSTETIIEIVQRHIKDVEYGEARKAHWRMGNW